jgi:hypothetical protein
MEVQKIHYYSKLIELRRELTPNEKAELINYLRPYVLASDVEFMEKCASNYYLIRLLQEIWRNNNRQS